MTPRFFRGAAWLFVLGFALVVYRPGLSGGFVLDDHNNLGELENIKGRPFLESAPYYVMQGFAGPTGRPLSLLSFALQRESWPAEPGGFKRVNLAIHLLNGTLLLLLGLYLRRSCPDSIGILPVWVPWLAAGMWLLLPIHSSTVFYVVQRMAILAATCMIAGLLIYITAWRAWARGQHWQAHSLFAAACLVGLLLGMLCKESAGVFPLLALSLHGLRAAESVRPTYPRVWSAALWSMAATIGMYLLFVMDLKAGYSVRPFDLSQRLLTESRVLWLYLYQIVAPSTAILHFHYDGLEVSSSLISPPTTVVAVLGWLMVSCFALMWWRRVALAAFPVIFFLSAHALESTFLPLELAFEHRNYLASFGVSFGVAAGLGTVWQKASRQGRLPLIVLSGMYLILLSWVALSQNRLWGNELDAAVHRFEQQPQSRRAIADLANELAQGGWSMEATALLDQAIVDFPGDAALLVQRAELACIHADLKLRTLGSAESALRRGTHNLLSAFAVLDRLAGMVESGLCPAYSKDELLALIDAATSNPQMGRHRASLLLIAGRLHASAGDNVAARRLLDQAISIRPRPTVIVQAAAWELGHRNLPAAERYIQMLGPEGNLSWRDRMAIAPELEKLERWLAELKAIEKD